MPKGKVSSVVPLATDHGLRQPATRFFIEHAYPVPCSEFPHESMGTSCPPAPWPAAPTQPWTLFSPWYHSTPKIV